LQMSNNTSSSSSQDPTRPARKSGRAVFDDDGRCSWEWQTSTGVFSSNITNEQLTSLEAPHLELVDPNAATLTRTQRPLPRVVVPAAKPSRASGKLRRLLRRVAQLLS
jgi:hypothetical protein